MKVLRKLDGSTRTIVAGTWTVTYDAKPWTANQDKNLHHHARADKVAEWRKAFWGLAGQAKIPTLAHVGITVRPYYRRWNGKFPDPASCAPAAKAAIDGLVDAGVMPDDGPQYVAWVKFLPAVMDAGRDALALVVEVVEP